MPIESQNKVIEEIQRIKRQRSFSDRRTLIALKPDAYIDFRIPFRDGYYEIWWDDTMLCFAKTLEGLSRELQQALSFMWREYALCPDDMLSPGALELKRRMLDTFNELKRP